MITRGIRARPVAGSMRVIATAAAGMLFLSGCMTARGPVAYGNLPEADPVTVATVATTTISPLDKVSVRVFGFTELSGNYEVDLAGQIGMPLIGQVKAVPLSTAELQDLLKARYSEKYLQSPDITVGIIESSQRVVTLDGAVNRPNQYRVAGTTSLLQVMALAGGPSPDANPRRVVVFRTVGGQRMAAAFDLTKIRRGEAEDPTIYSGDIVIVDGSRIQSTYRTVMQALPMLSLINAFVPIF